MQTPDAALSWGALWLFLQCFLASKAYQWQEDTGLALRDGLGREARAPSAVSKEEAGQDDVSPRISPDARPSSNLHADRANLHTFYNLSYRVLLTADSMEKLFSNTARMLSRYHTFTHRDQSEMEQKVLSPARQYLRAKAGFPWNDDMEAMGFKGAAERLQVVVEEGEKLAPLCGEQHSLLWKENCIAAFLSDGILLRTWEQLSDVFRRDHRVSAIIAAARHSELPTLGFLLEQGGKLDLTDAENCRLMDSMCAGNGLTVYETIRRFIPRNVFWIEESLVKYDNLELLQLYGGLQRGLSGSLLSRLIGHAASFGHVKTFKYLLGQMEANTFLPDAALIRAAEAGNLDILRVIATSNSLSTWSYSFETYEDMLFGAVKGRHHEVVAYLLSRQVTGEPLWEFVTPNMKENQAFSHACHNEDTEMFDILLGSRSGDSTLFPSLDIGAFNNRILLETIKAGSLRMVKYILGKAANVNDRHFQGVDFTGPDNAPLLTTVRLGHFAIFKLLLDEKSRGHPKLVPLAPHLVQRVVCGLGDTRFAMELFRLTEDGTTFQFPQLSVSDCRKHGGATTICDFLERLRTSS